MVRGHLRFQSHEELLRSVYTECAHSDHHYGGGHVTWDAAVPGTFQAKILNNTVYEDGTLLNREYGEFRVPANASGTYLFTFTAVLDSVQ